MQEETKVPAVSSLAMAAAQEQDLETIMLEVYMDNDRVKAFQTQMRTLRHMRVSEYRSKFEMPP
jgi:hypothetical protein